LRAIHQSKVFAKVKEEISPWKNKNGFSFFVSEDVKHALWDIAKHEWDGTKANAFFKPK
jgi:hypothetical protein